MESPKSKLKIVRVGCKITENGLLVSLPKAAIQYLGITDKNKVVFAVPIEGIIQLSAQAPNIAIPVARITEDDFVKQT